MERIREEGLMQGDVINDGLLKRIHGRWNGTLVESDTLMNYCSLSQLIIQHAIAP